MAYIHSNHIRYPAPNVTFSMFNVQFKEQLSLSVEGQAELVKRPFNAAW